VIVVRLKRLRIGRCLATALLLITSVTVSLAVSEAILRLLFDPVDYLMPNLVADDILRHKVEPYSGGHDAWGFRNKSVPDKADIVAIGDSLTYGVSASAANSWPAVLQRLTNQKVYNLALGGYGPADYRYLLESKAVLLHPSSIIVGFYYGNDLIDAFNMVYRRAYWKYLRTSGFVAPADEPANRYQPVARFHWLRSDDGVFFGSLRNYLAHRSLLYRASMLSSGEMLRFLEMKYVTVNDVSILEDKDLGIRTGFTPVATLTGLNLDDPKVKEGLRITLTLLLEMDRFCESNGIRFHVLLLPTKENVFSKYIDADSIHLKDQNVIHKAIENENKISKLIKQYFDQNHIAYIDVLGPLQEALAKKSIYPSNDDAHPNKFGYEIIARSVLARLNDE
jgi:lysophospholipase L1-like esterase